MHVADTMTTRAKVVCPEHSISVICTHILESIALIVESAESETGEFADKKIIH
ncbi:MAG: hypothetical protein J07HQX50_01175 [Haloquadratum sp. J07HQX50]|jgi:hypothetical protein|nr:MAG: hypothetical protein J07HQX50_01175 [Haloquadratum sp. J07HQX50]